MKQKFLFATLALGLGLFAASCNKAELVSTGDDVLATFTISTPGTMTKAETAGKGESVDKVKCVTFDDAGAEIAALTQTVPVTSKKATYSTRLVKGQAYRVAFFAYNDAAAAYDLNDLKNITVAASQPANAEGRDAFTAFVDISATDTEAPISKEVHLYRPFAQLNIACSASDLAAATAAGITVAQSKVKISGTGVAFGAFNAYEDKVAGTAIDEVEYSLANIIAGETITVDNVTYNSLSMNYFLVGDKGEKNTATVEFEWAGSSKSGSATWTNVPLQRNYRTNIIGDILTNPAAFNIIVDDPFDGDINITSYDVPDGQVLYDGAPVASISDALTAAGNTDAALELGNGTYPMASNFSGNSLTIHGNGASVIDATNAWGGAGNEPKFQFRGKTVVFENLTVKFSNDNAYSGIGVHATSVTYKNCKITGMQWAYDNIHFIDCEFENPEKCSVLVYGPNITFEGCSFKNGNSTWDEGGVKVYTEGGAASVELTRCKFHPYGSETHIRGGVTINPQLLSTNRYTVTITDCESDYLINGNVWSFESTTGQDKVDLTVK